MNSAILSVGTELLFGDTLNTNATYLSQQLNMLGFNVLYHVTVGDNESRLEDTIKELRDKVDLIITTGGLGPTEDDLTKETICKIYNNKLMLNDYQLNKIQDYFKKSNRKMPENNIKQAMLPENGIIFENPCGTAPGFGIENDNSLIISLPGPPREMKAMFEQHVAKYLMDKSNEKFYSRTLRFFGIGESKLEHELIHLIHGQTDPTLATYAKDGQCTLRITTKDADPTLAKTRVEDMILLVKEKVGQYLYSCDNEELYQIVGKKLIEKNLTISAAESCTAGLFVSTLAKVPGISTCLKESYITYSNDVKMKVLGVKKDTLDKYTEVSEKTAKEMSEGLYRATGSDICISVTGLAGPGGGTEAIPVGTVFIGLTYNGQTLVKNLNLNDNGREYLRNYAMLHMFDMINQII